MKIEFIPLSFDPANPFPLVAANDVSYADEKSHSAEADAWLGLQTENIEKLLVEASTGIKSPAREFWIGKSVQTFSTPYTELRAMLEEIRPEPNDTVIDLGAGYGRLAHVLNAHFPDSNFVGFEIVRERQIEAQRVIAARKISNSRVELADVNLIDFETLNASIYFLYDFGSRQDVESCIENLKRVASRLPITVAARGGRSREVIEKLHPWLSQVVKPVHHDHYSIYRSAEKSVENS